MRAVNNTDRHAVFDNELHQVFFYGSEEVLTRLFHQRHHQLQDLRHVTYHHKVILSLEMSNWRELFSTKRSNGCFHLLTLGCSMARNKSWWRSVLSCGHKTQHMIAYFHTSKKIMGQYRTKSCSALRCTWWSSRAAGSWHV